jgi:hypothetical protein
MAQQNRKRQIDRFRDMRDARDTDVRMGGLFRISMLGMGRVRTPNILPLNAPMPEPDEELEGSELSDVERREAIARERLRREGII